ncbi:MAG: type II toxin-antitoxin system PemK/MazF family toxin [Desulfobulbaceae bacterium]|nr:type II toxin-antitoxin system PemK/MazF family toxin [Desulfobulbaceae bacterium]
MYNQREIVLVPFPYSDLTSVKRRPVVILSNNRFNENRKDLVVAAITSKEFTDEYSVIITNNELEYGILPEPSVIKISKLFTIHKSKVVKKFSILNHSSFEEVTKKLRLLFENG